MKTQWKDKRQPAAQIFLALVGASAFCYYSYSWIDPVHLLYDIPAGIATFAFVAQLPLELYRDGPRPFWLYRFAMLAGMTIATVGRQYGGWPISGHLSCVLAVALVQGADPRLYRVERILYWVPVPIVLYLRLALLEHDGHWGTCIAIIFALLWGAPGAILAAGKRHK